MSPLTALFISARPKQWTKNLLLYLALLFTANESWGFENPMVILGLSIKTTLAVVFFCGLSASIYLVNDLLDVQRDKTHPSKQSRPIASGLLRQDLAWLVAILLSATMILFSFLLEPLFGWTCIAYSVLMVCYSVILKRIVVIDMIVISSGFVLRAVAGASVLQVPVSPWLYTCTGLGALFIVLTKRRSELAQSSKNASNQRETLGWYTEPFLNYFTLPVAALTMLSYALYAFSAPNLPDNHSMLATIPFVFFGLCRYLFLVYNKGLGESPEDVLLSDVPLVLSISLWLASSAIMLTMFRT